MLISLSEVLETPVSVLLGETVIETEEKLEVINLQLAQRKTMRRKMIRWSLMLLSAIIVEFESPYLGWDYSDPETAVLSVAFHSCEWLFVRVAPVILVGAIIGICQTGHREKSFIALFDIKHNRK